MSKKINRGERQFEEELDAGAQIARISEVLMPRYEDEPIYIGWTEDGRPIATSHATQLSEAARTSVELFGQSTSDFARNVDYSTIDPANFVMVGAMVDFQDDPATGKVAEDFLRVSVSREAGKANPGEIRIGERALLKAILDARNPYQDVGKAAIGEVAQSAMHMYTLLIPIEGDQEAESAHALLFQAEENFSNEAAFAYFMREVIARLLMLDETSISQGKHAKGYVEAAASIAGVDEASTVGQIFSGLRKAGFVDFDDQWLKGLDKGVRRVGVRAIRLAAAFGFVNIEDERVLQEIETPLPNYEISNGDLNQLFEIIEKFDKVARSTIGLTRHSTGHYY